MVRWIRIILAHHASILQQKRQRRIILHVCVCVRVCACVCMCVYLQQQLDQHIVQGARATPNTSLVLVALEGQAGEKPSKIIKVK